MLESRPSSCLCRMKQTRLGWVRLSSKAKYERYENCHLVLVVVAGNSWTRGPPIVWLWWSTLSAWWLLKILELEIPSQVLNKNTSFLFFPLRKLCANSRTRCANCAPYGLSGNTAHRCITTTSCPPLPGSIHPSTHPIHHFPSFTMWFLLLHWSPVYHLV